MKGVHYGLLRNNIWDHIWDHRPGFRAGRTDSRHYTDRRVSGCRLGHRSDIGLNFLNTAPPASANPSTDLDILTEYPNFKLTPGCFPQTGPVSYFSTSTHICQPSVLT